MPFVESDNGLQGQSGTTALVARSEFPKQPKTTAMPTEKRVGLEDEQSLLPVLNAAGEDDQPESIGWRKGRPFDLAAKDDELLAQQGILGDEISFTACEIYRSTEHNRLAGGLCAMEEALFKERNETNDEFDPRMKEGQHAVAPKSCQKRSSHGLQHSGAVKFWMDKAFSQHSHFDMGRKADRMI